MLKVLLNYWGGGIAGGMIGGLIVYRIERHYLYLRAQRDAVAMIQRTAREMATRWRNTMADPNVSDQARVAARIEAPGVERMVQMLDAITVVGS
jgi:hypothetical protein